MESASSARTIRVDTQLTNHWKHKPKNICLSGGVSLNCVFTGKLFDWYPGINVYCDPIPYDAGLALGSARYIYHDVLDNPRIYNNVQNATPYLGRNYSEQEIADAIDPMTAYITKKRENMSSDEIAQIQNTGTITEDKGLWDEDKGMIWNANFMNFIVINRVKTILFLH